MLEEVCSCSATVRESRCALEVEPLKWVDEGSCLFFFDDTANDLTRYRPEPTKGTIPKSVDK